MLCTNGFPRNPLYGITCNRNNENIQLDQDYDPSRVIDILRLFIDLVDTSGFQDDPCLNGSRIIETICWCHPYVRDSPNKEDVFLWMLHLFGSSLHENVDDSWIYYCLWLSGSTSSPIRSDERFSYILDITNGKVDALNAVGGWSLLHRSMLDPSTEDLVCRLLAVGADAHLEGRSNRVFPKQETPTSLAIYSASTLVMLQNVLTHLSVDMNAFVDLEMEQSPLQLAGWNKDSLLALLSSDVNELYCHRCYDECCRFCAISGTPSVQPYWMHELQKIKDGSPGNLLGSTSESWYQLCDNREESCVVEEIALKNRHSQQTQSKSQDFQNLSSQTDKDDGVMQNPNASGSDYIKDEFMCFWCWREWEETGRKPLLDESTCLHCGQLLRAGRGRPNCDTKLCWDCRCKQEQEWCSTGKTQTYGGDNDSSTDDDEYSPYLFPT